MKTRMKGAVPVQRTPLHPAAATCPPAHHSMAFVPSASHRGDTARNPLAASHAHPRPTHPDSSKHPGLSSLSERLPGDGGGRRGTAGDGSGRAPKRSGRPCGPAARPASRRGPSPAAPCRPHEDRARGRGGRQGRAGPGRLRRADGRPAGRPAGCSRADPPAALLTGGRSRRLAGEARDRRAAWRPGGRRPSPLPARRSLGQPPIPRGPSAPERAPAGARSGPQTPRRAPAAAGSEAGRTPSEGLQAGLAESRGAAPRLGATRPARTAGPRGADRILGEWGSGPGTIQARAVPPAPPPPRHLNSKLREGP